MWGLGSRTPSHIRQCVGNSADDLSTAGLLHPVLQASREVSTSRPGLQPGIVDAQTPDEDPQYLPAGRQLRRNFVFHYSVYMAPVAYSGYPSSFSGPSYQSYRPFLDKNFSESTDTSFNASSTPTSMMERP